MKIKNYKFSGCTQVVEKKIRDIMGPLPICLNLSVIEFVV